MSGETVSIKGISDGLLITLSVTDEWLTITSELANRLDEKTDFFNGAKVTVNLGERPVPKYELSSLKALLERRGMMLAVVQSDSSTTIESATALDLRTAHINSQTAERASNDEDVDTPIDPEETGTTGVLVRRTLRSGRTVHSDGHVVIIGDVNPGAQIIATGDIIVWGKLRGMVHAGAEGDETAVICALDMSPNQLRIAGHIATSPKDRRKRINPEAARVRDNQIVVEAWSEE